MDKKADHCPTVILGAIQGSVRLETNGGRELYTTLLDKVITLFCWFKPITVIGEDYAPTHIQKESLFGFLLYKPLIFHFWISFRKQQINESGQYIPGSERVFYFRTPGWRWDSGDSKYILSKGYIGLHWD